MNLLPLVLVVGLVLKTSGKFIAKRNGNKILTEKDFEKCGEPSLPIFDEKIQSVECYFLATQGPCDKGEWLLMNPEGTDDELPSCKPRDCPGDFEVLYKVIVVNSITCKINLSKNMIGLLSPFNFIWLIDLGTLCGGKEPS